MVSFRHLARAVLLTGLLLAPPAFAHTEAPLDPTEAPPKQVEGVDVTEHLGGSVQHGLAFKDEQGRAVTLGQYFDGKHPAILMRTPYKKEIFVTAAKYYARRGYAVAVQDCRGRFSSEGVWEPFLNEGKDGFDAIGQVLVGGLLAAAFRGVVGRLLGLLLLDYLGLRHGDGVVRTVTGRHHGACCATERRVSGSC